MTHALERFFNWLVKPKVHGITLLLFSAISAASGVLVMIQFSQPARVHDPETYTEVALGRRAIEEVRELIRNNVILPEELAGNIEEHTTEKSRNVEDFLLSNPISNSNIQFTPESKKASPKKHNNAVDNEPINLLVEDNEKDNIKETNSDNSIEFPWYIQLSSQRTEDASRLALKEILHWYSALLNGTTPFIREVNLGDRGIYYRILIGARSIDDANKLCASIKRADGDCFVRND